MEASEISSFANKMVEVISLEDTAFVGILRKHDVRDWYYIEFEKGVRFVFHHEHIKTISRSFEKLTFSGSRKYERK